MIDELVFDDKCMSLDITRISPVKKPGEVDFPSYGMTDKTSAMIECNVCGECFAIDYDSMVNGSFVGCGKDGFGK